MRIFHNLKTWWVTCRKSGHIWEFDGYTLGGYWIRCIRCHASDEYLAGLHEPKGGYSESLLKFPDVRLPK